MENLGEDIKDDKLELLEESFNRSIKLSGNLFGENAFRKSLIDKKKIRVLNRALFEVITVLFSELSETQIKNLKSNKSEFVKGFKMLLNNENFFTAISYSTTVTDNVKYRFDQISELIKKFY
jgi:hypothetical protein